jgi:hypothetical protein
MKRDDEESEEENKKEGEVGKAILLTYLLSNQISIKFQ